mmetsp:Transcript_40203/g.65150  ORF Transcript_40203/g.65150 Transcript_40203/m.65150 type:complete len:156 (+) Transcript_40203:296-763(+)
MSSIAFVAPALPLSSGRLAGSVGGSQTRSLASRPSRSVSTSVTRRSFQVTMTTEPAPKGTPVWFVNPSGEGDFGFGWNAEKWNGRLAMLGFAAGIGQEALTGQSIFQQIGLDAPLDRVLVLLALLAVSIAVPLGYIAVNGPQPSLGALGEEVDLD